MSEYARKLKVDLFRYSGNDHSSRVTLEDNVLTYRRDGSNLVHRQRELSSDEVGTIQDLIGGIEKVHPSFYYPGHHRSRKPTSVLAITRTEPPFRRTITMVANPHNPAPPEVLSTVRYLLTLV